MKQGFTLVELVIVIAIMAILFLIVGSLSVGTLGRTQLNTQASVVTKMLRKAQVRSIHQQADSQWGVQINSGEITLFAGSSYAARDTDLDQQHVFPQGITATGISEVVFTTIVGETVDVGTITLTAQGSGETQNIDISSTGLIQ